MTDDEILSLEREAIDGSVRNDAAVEWSSEKKARSWLTPQEINISNTFFEHVGRHVRSIEFFEFDAVDVVLSTILRRCVSLKHLGIGGSTLSSDGIDILLDALNGDLGNQLLSLNLDAAQVAESIVAKIAKLLTNPARTPALRELRASIALFSNFQAYFSLHRALEINKHLRVLELEEPSPPPYETGVGDPDGQYYDTGMLEEYQRIQNTHGELLLTALPLNQKLAFLSAIEHKSVAGSARPGLDSFMVSSIFQVCCGVHAAHDLIG